MHNRYKQYSYLTFNTHTSQNTKSAVLPKNTNNHEQIVKSCNESSSVILREKQLFLLKYFLQKMTKRFYKTWFYNKEHKPLHITKTPRNS